MNRTERIELYRDFQKHCHDLVKTEAVMYGISEYSVEIRTFRTKISLFVHRYSVSLTFYISGRVVIEQITDDNEILSDSVYSPYTFGRCTISQLMGDLVYDLFDRALLLKEKRTNNLKLKPPFTPVNEDNVEEIISLFDDEINTEESGV